MNEHTFQKLEFEQVREVIARYCGSALGKHLARTMTPSVKADVVALWLRQVAELARVAEEIGFPPMGGVHDVREHVRASGFPAPLEADALANVAETLMATESLCRWFAKARVMAGSLGDLADRVADLSSIAKSIYEAIEPRGVVRDYASPKLANIRRTIEESKSRIRIVFDRILRQAGITKMLQYAASTFHNDRMVLPLKAEYRGRIQGIVHRSSDSGATMFIEPSESVELNNTVMGLRDEESREITQILKGLTHKVQVNTVPILNTLRAMAVVDLIAAKVKYMKKRGCTCPEIDLGRPPDGRSVPHPRSSEDGAPDRTSRVGSTEPTFGGMSLRDARHPLLVELFAKQEEETGVKHEVVANDVRLGEDFDVLVLTGPNTGGKTAMLKTVGLLALMTQCGIPIPAGERSRMPVYRGIFIDIGDEQSLQQSLSTFSSHLSNQLDILRHSGPNTLVLIDELGAGTDPDEGAAIGRSIIHELLELKAKAVVTTHLSALKAVAFSAPRVDNGCVEFDPETLRPTFRLRIGEPGNSNALIIAKRLGMSARLVKQAKDYLADTNRALNRAIAGTLESKREAEAARRAAHDATLEAQRSRDELEKEREELRRTQEAVARWTAWVNALKPGDVVYLKTLQREAKVVRMQMHKQIAVVSARGMDLEVSLRDIREFDPAVD